MAAGGRFLALVFAAAWSTAENGEMKTGDRRQAETLLEIELPEAIGEVHAFRWQPSGDLHYFHAYVKLIASRQDFLDLVERLRLAHRRAAESAGYLPAAWEAPRGVDLPWWDPGADTPPDSAARAYGTNGWVVAKYEDGQIFLILTDSGAETGTPGPW